MSCTANASALPHAAFSPQVEPDSSRQTITSPPPLRIFSRLAYCVRSFALYRRRNCGAHGNAVSLYARRISVVDAFRNATGRVTRSITQNSHGLQEVYRNCLFRRQLDETDSEFDTLRLYSQELQVRAMGLRTKKAA